MANEPSWDDIFSPRPAEPAADAAAAAFPFAEPAAPAPASEPVPSQEQPAPAFPPAYEPPPAYPSPAPDYFETVAPASTPAAPPAPALDPNPFGALFEPEPQTPIAAPIAAPVADPSTPASQPAAWPAEPTWNTPAPQQAVWQAEPAPAAAAPQPWPASEPVPSWPGVEQPVEPASAAWPEAAPAPAAAPTWSGEQPSATWPVAAEPVAPWPSGEPVSAPAAWTPEPAAPPAWTPEPAAPVAWTPETVSEAWPAEPVAPMPDVAWNTVPLEDAPVPARSLPEWPSEPEEQYPPTAVYPLSEPVAASAPELAPATEPHDALSAFEGLFAAPVDEVAPTVPEAHAAAPVVVAAAAATPFVAEAAPAASTPSADFSPDDPFSGLFGNPMGSVAADSRSAAPTGRGTDGAGGEGSGGGRGGSGGRGGRGRGGDGTPPRRKRSLKWLAITLPIVIVLGLGAGGAAFAWLNYEEQVRELLGWELPNDFEGTGNGEEVIVTIQSGDIGSDVANTLKDAGVTMTFDAFYDLLLEQSDDVNFLPGNYALQKQMSAQSALDALMNPENKVTSRLLITEGTVLPSALEIIAETTGIPLEDVQAAAADPTVYGAPANAPSLEGYLFPATYELDGTESAEGILQRLVDEMFTRLDALGVAPENRHEVLTKAAIVQREAGSNQDDFYKIARVFQNRLDQGMNLQSDATVAYGTGNLHTVWTTDAERADAGNLYNTYANAGLPIGPIGAPGEVAIRSVLAPADGPWLFFVPINLATGETVFSETADEHEAAVEQLRAWCRESDENASYCE